MSARFLISRLVHHGRQALRSILPSKRELLLDAERGLLIRGRCGGTGTGIGRGPGYLTQRFLGRFSQTQGSQAARMRRDAAKRLMYAGRDAAPYLGFVGVNLVTGYGIINKEDEMEGICEEIRVCMGAAHWQKTGIAHQAKSLEGLEVGNFIGKGCSAVIHAAKWKTDVGDSEPCNEIADSVLTEESMSSSACVTPNHFTDVDESEDTERLQRNNNCQNLLQPKYNGYNLAVKMMFNYEAESNADAILRAMNREIVPARSIQVGEQADFNVYRNHFRKKHLPSHPNLVDLQWVFVDSVPFLPRAMSLYPDALPRRLNAGGCGRNMTLFLVMKRYQCSLQEYLSSYTPSPTTSVLLLTQLLEGVEHLVRHRIAHRDLKTDNILLDVSQGLDTPRLVITDFGCCLADDKLGLKLPYSTEETDRGGNSALMAPEVATATPGLFNSIDYSAADLWAVGALAYEIFGVPNPFYRSLMQKSALDSRGYDESQLPDLPSNVPRPIAKLVKRMLSVNPDKRPSPAVAANVGHLLAWGPPSVMQSSLIDILEWLVLEAAFVFCQPSFSVEVSDMTLLLRYTFLRRIRIQEIKQALEFFN